MCIQKGDLQGQLDRLQCEKKAVEKRLKEESSRHEKVILDELCQSAHVHALCMVL